MRPTHVGIQRDCSLRPAPSLLGLRPAAERALGERRELEPLPADELAELRVRADAHLVSCALEPGAEGRERLDVATRADGDDRDAHQRPSAIPA